MSTSWLLLANKLEIPPVMIQKNKTRRVGTSMFCFDKDLTLVSYKAEENKLVTMLSTIHEQPVINKDKKTRNCRILQWNQGECRHIRPNVSSPFLQQKDMAMAPSNFYDILNIAGINSWIIYREIMTQKNENAISRINYMKN